MRDSNEALRCLAYFRASQMRNGAVANVNGAGLRMWVEKMRR